VGASDPAFLHVDMPAVPGAEVAYNSGPGETSMIKLRLTQGPTLRFDSEIEAITLARLIRCVEAA
jgi:transposase